MKRGSVMKGGSDGASPLYLSSAPDASQCFGEGTRREMLSLCIVHGGGWVQSQTREEISAGSEHFIPCSSCFSEACRQCQEPAQCEAAGASHPPSSSVLALGATLGSGDVVFWLSLCHLLLLPRLWWPQMWAEPWQLLCL